MFHIQHLKSDSEYLDKVWKIANDINTGNEEFNLPEICRGLDNWITSEAFEIHRRLSLRTSATLINGAARLYKIGMNKLLEDIKTLEQNMSFRKRRYAEVTSNTSDSSDSSRTPEQMRQQVNQHLDTSISPNKRTKTSSTSVSDDIPSYSRSRSSLGSTSLNCIEKAIRNSNNPRCDQSSCNGSNICVGNPQNCDNNTNASENSRKDRGVQTSLITTRPERNNSSSEAEFDEDLPFAYILIHDNYHSRVPSKIILSSINSDVRNLL